MEKNTIIKLLFDEAKKVILERENISEKDLTYDGVWLDEKIAQVFLMDIVNDCYYVAIKKLNTTGFFILKTGKISMYYTDEEAKKDILKFIGEELKKI